MCPGRHIVPHSEVTRFAAVFPPNCTHWQGCQPATDGFAFCRHLAYTSDCIRRTILGPSLTNHSNTYGMRDRLSYWRDVPHSCRTRFRNLSTSGLRQCSPVEALLLVKCQDWWRRRLRARNRVQREGKGTSSQTCMMFNVEAKCLGTRIC